MRTALVLMLIASAVTSSSKTSCAAQPDSTPNNHEALPRPVAGIENVWRIGPDLSSGGDPCGQEGLAKLKGLGFRSIVSVDGAAPDAASARRLGLRYVHVPIGYDGIDAAARLQLDRCMSELPKPIYVHCHHGKHRGPAAAAVMAMSGQGWTDAKAVDFMRRAGTSSDYPGLYDAVRNWRKPLPEELKAAREPLPEMVDVPDMVEMMVRIDQRFDRLKEWHAGSKGQQDVESTISDKIDPNQEAVQLRELVREAARLPECRDRPEEFRKAFVALESNLNAWIEAVTPIESSPNADPNRFGRLGAILKTASGHCVSCHKAYRDK